MSSILILKKRSNESLFIFGQIHHNVFLSITTDITTKSFFKDGIPMSASSGNSKDVVTAGLLEGEDHSELENDGKSVRQAWI